MNMIEMQAEKELVLMRTENGWLIRTQDWSRGSSVPLRVATTVDQLADEVRRWGAQQEHVAMKGDAR